MYVQEKTFWFESIVPTHTQKSGYSAGFALALMIVIIVYESNDREYKNIFLVFLLNKKKVDKCMIKVNIDTKLYTIFCVCCLLG